MAAAVLTLGERLEVDDVDPPGQRLRGLGESVEAGGLVDNEAPWGQAAVELRLDGVKHHRRLLKFVDTHRRRARHECSRLCGYRISNGRVVEIDHLGAVACGHCRQQRRFANGARSLQGHNRLIVQPSTHQL